MQDAQVASEGCGKQILTFEEEGTYSQKQELWLRITETKEGGKEG